MNKVLETKSQMIMRIAELSEANEQLEAEIEKQKRELCQRYEEPEFATFLLMGKTAKEWRNIQKENEQLKNGVKQLKGSIETLNTYSATYENEKLKQALQEIRDKLDFHKQELEECLYNPIDDEIREIINSAIGVK